MKTKLTNLTVEKIALVQEGDNKGAEVLVYKRRHSTQVQKTTQGGMIEMKIDRSKLTPEENAQLDDLLEKAGVPAPDENAVSEASGQNEDQQPEEKAVPADKETEDEEDASVTPETAAKVAQKKAEKQLPLVENGGIYKGLHPAVAAELESLRKWKDEAENRELLEIAKKYEIIGKKPEELATTLKCLKAAGNGTYDQMIAVLDASVQAVEQAGVFAEIGKSGHGSHSSDSGAWAQLEKHAEAIQKVAPDMSWHQAVDKACMQHPELVHEYEENR